MERNTLYESIESLRRICHVCLSTDRRLVDLDRYLDIFKSLCENNQIESRPLLCWECVAMLIKIKRFKQRVKLSTKILNKYIQRDCHPPLESLSNLKIIINESTQIDSCIETENVTDNIKSEIIVNSQDDNSKPIINCSAEEKKEELNIKIEDYDDNYNNNSEEDNTEYADNTYYNVKNETSPVTLKELKNNKKNPQNKQYRLISNKMKYLVRRIPLNIKEVKTYMAKERLNELYMKLNYKCETCVSSYKSENKFKQHNEKYHTVGNYYCDICHSQFISKKDITCHMRRHFTILECVVCSHRSYRVLMKRHLRSHQEKIQCIKCDARFTNIYSFYQHHRDLHVVFICDVCGKKASTKEIIERHIMHHYETHECKLCNRTYKTKHALKRHRLEKHSPDTDDSYCVPCDKKFANAVLYRKHVNRSARHAAERDGAGKKVSCPDCGRLYARRVYMTNHYKHVHLKQTKFYCEQCNKYFLNRTRYSEHMKYNHEGVVKPKNKLCNICGRGFAAQRTLVNHIRTHSGERPYECSHCHAKFTQKYAMLSHVNYVHLKIKRPKCWQ